MGLYRYITEEETKAMKTVSDKELNELLQEALKYDDTLLIDESTISVNKGWFSHSKEVVRLSVYHEERAWDGSSYQAQYMSISGKLKITAYLMGIINGGEAMKRKEAEGIKTLAEVRDVLLEIVEANECGYMVACTVSNPECVVCLAKQIKGQYLNLKNV